MTAVFKYIKRARKQLESYLRTKKHTNFCSLLGNTLPTKTIQAKV